MMLTGVSGKEKDCKPDGKDINVQGLLTGE